MSNIESWLSQWEQATDLMERAKLLEQLPEDGDSINIEHIERVWKVRYYYPDKKRTRIGDRFIWTYLMMAVSHKDKIGQKELMRVYETNMNSPAAQKAFAESYDEMVANIHEAARTYVRTLGEARPILGLIPMKDKNPDDRVRRVAGVIVEGHLLVFWKVCKELPHAQLMVEALLKAAKEEYGGVEYRMRDEMEKQTTVEYREWLGGLIYSLFDEETQEIIPQD